MSDVLLPIRSSVNASSERASRVSDSSALLQKEPLPNTDEASEHREGFLLFYAVAGARQHRSEAR